MATERLKIILDAVWKGGSDVRKAKKDIDDVDEAAEKSERSFGKLATGIGAATLAFGAAAVAARATWGILKEGAALETTTRKFDRLAESIGTTGSALKNDLKEGIGLLMSNAEQAALATDLMSLGLTNAHDDTVRLANVAGQLGMDLNQLVLTLSNRTTMRFDSLGVAVAGFDEKVKRLEATGMAADEAFKWAFIEQAEDQLKRVGSIAGTTDGKLLALENTVKNAQDTFSKEFSSSFVRQLDEIGYSADQLDTKLSGMAAKLAASILLGAELSSKTSLLKVPGSTMVGGMSGLPLTIQAMSMLLDPAFRKNMTVPDMVSFLERFARGPISDAAPNVRPELMRGAVQPTPMLPPGTPQQIQQTGQQYRDLNNIRQESADLADKLRQKEIIAADQRAKAIAVTDDLADSIAEYGNASAIASEKVLALVGNTGELFGLARQDVEIDPFEFMLDQAQQAGADAMTLYKLGMEGEVFTPEEGDKFLNKAAILAAAKSAAQLAATQEITPATAVGIVKGIEQGIEDGDILAKTFFEDLEKEAPKPTLLLETETAWEMYRTLVQRIESNPPNIWGRDTGGGGGGGGGNGSGSPPADVGDIPPGSPIPQMGGVIIHNHTAAAAAITNTMVGVTRRRNIDAMMGVI